MKLKNISRMLAFGIFLNSIPINSFASVLSEDTRYETFTESDITINDILEEDKTDIKIEGNTLVNLWSLDNVYLHDGMTISNGYVNVTTDGSTWFTPSIKNIDILKPNTTYTVITEIIDSTFDSDKILSVNIQRNEESSSDDNRRVPLSNGIYTSILTTKNDLSKATVGIRTQFEPDKTGIGSCKLRMIMLEGDYTDKPIPEYFEGLQSSFEDQLVTQEMIDNGQEKAENLGKYKVEVKTTGKNLFKENFVKGMIVGANGTFYEGGTDYMSSIDYTPVKPNTKYTFSGDIIDAVFAYDKDYNYLGYYFTDNTAISRSFTTYRNCKYIKARYQPILVTNKKFQLEEGSVSTEYEPYKESISTFYLNSPLLKGDTIEYINGQATHVHRTKKVILDGSEDESYTWYDSNVSTMIEWNTNDIYTPHGIMFCDRLPIVDYDGRVSINNTNVGVSSVHHKAIRIRVAVGIMTLNEFKEWFKNNPITLIYKISEPIYEPIKTDLSVNLFEGTTHISNNSNIPTIMEVTVDRTLNRAVEFTELAKVTPTINNLSKARYWNNLLKDSIKKDQLQEEVNSITKLNDMQLERKNVTSNLDLYIKSENMLSMSLDTNNITFEDFSGVEDMVKENSVQISISSSLPYSLNAYLPSEIQNSDKSNTMNKDILNIKDNSETAYQTFDNTTDKIILKDNNQAGNDLIHDVDIKLKGGIAHQKDVYKTTIKFEAEQK